MKSNVLELLSSYDNPVVGVGVTAFNRIGASFFLKNYYLAFIRNSQDLSLYKNQVKDIFCLEQLSRKKIGQQHSQAVLEANEIIAKILPLNPNPYLLLYKSSIGIEKISDKYGFKILGNRSQIRDQFENKGYFSQVLKQTGIEDIPSENLAVTDLESKINSYKKIFGEKLVLKFPDISIGGGVSIIFLRNKNEWQQFPQKLKALQKEYVLKTAVVQKFIEGISPSITGCVTKYGVLTSRMQTQVIDEPEVVSLAHGSGLFCGHDWQYWPYSENSQKQAETICEKFGAFMQKKGYKGIFGLDLLLEKGTGKIYPCECNPRYTGAFPTYTLMQLKDEKIPMEAFHLAEHLNLNYEADFEKVNKSYKTINPCSQLILFNKKSRLVTIAGNLAPGIYEVKNNQLGYKKQSFLPKDIENDQQFIYIDGCPKQGSEVKAFGRLGRLIFGGGILEADGKTLKGEIKKTISLVYRNLGLN